MRILFGQSGQGADAAIHIEKYLKTGIMNFDALHARDTRIEINADEIDYQELIKAADDIYSKDEAKNEAQRCLRCNCTRCEDSCEFMQYYRTGSRKIANLIAFGLDDKNLEPVSNNRLVNSCTDCGVCKEVCPFDIATGDQIQAGRRKMFDKKMIPPAYHHYWIMDMHHAASEEASLYLPAENEKQAKYLFFPGCQLGASDPDYPIAAYQLLKSVEPDTAVMMNCCGAPAYWSGDVRLHQEMLSKIQRQWNQAGQPKLICACLTCLRLFRRFLPEIEVLSLYKVLAEKNQLSLPEYTNRSQYVLVDPCSVKFDQTSRQDVQALLQKMKVDHEVLYEDIEKMPCCSFGGNIEGANPEFAKIMRSNRVEADLRPYLTYCSNCRDIFAGEGKSVSHILDLLANLNRDDRLPPHLSTRRRNRLEAKSMFTHKEIVMDEPKIKLIISDQMADMMDDKLILEEDLIKVIDYAERTGSKFIDDSGINIAHLVIGLPTIWVEYRELGKDTYEIVNCYSHRMTMVEPGREDISNN